MFKVNEDVILGYVGTINDQSEEEIFQFTDNILDSMNKDNPAILEFIREYIKNIESSDFAFPKDMSTTEKYMACRLSGFIQGSTLIYGMFMRHFESTEFEEKFS